MSTDRETETDPSLSVLGVSGAEPDRATGSMFPVSFRGYDRYEVEQHIADLHDHISLVTRDRETLVRELADLRRDITEAAAVEEQAGYPTYRQMGERIAHIFTLAEQEVTSMRAEALRQVQAANEEAVQIMAAATEEAAAALQSAERDAERTLRAARTEATLTTRTAQDQAAVVVGDATDKATAMLDDASDEAARVAEAGRAAAEEVEADRERRIAAIDRETAAHTKQADREARQRLADLQRRLDETESVSRGRVVEHERQLAVLQNQLAVTREQAAHRDQAVVHDQPTVSLPTEDDTGPVG